MDKLNIFVSSTIDDLKPERLAAQRAINELKFEPVLLESVGALPYSGPDASVIFAAKADIYILIIGGRYGTPPAGETRSVTEMEFNTAEKQGLPILAYVKDLATREPDENAFLERVRGKYLHRQPFKTPEELAEGIQEDLAGEITRLIHARGWESHKRVAVPNVLIASLGKSPGAVTALYHGLTNRLHIPIHKVITVYPRGNLEIQGCVERLKRVFRDKSVEYEPQPFEGEDLKDEAEVYAFRQKIADLLRQYEEDKGFIYLGIAGGRSSMGALMAMTARDMHRVQLYHLWVSDSIENDGEIVRLVAQSTARQQQILFPPEDEYEIVHVPFA